MSSDCDEKRPRAQSSFIRALDILSNKTVLEKIQRSIKTKVSICQSSGDSDANRLIFAADISAEDDQGEEKLKTLGDQLEEFHKYPDWRVERIPRQTTPHFDRMYRKLILLSPANGEEIQAFVDQHKAQEAQHQTEVKKSRR